MAGQQSGEFRGKTIEAAINAGLAALGVTRDAVQIEVVRPGSRGVLGIGAEDAIVRLTVLAPARPEPKPAPRPETPPSPPPGREAKPQPLEPQPTAKPTPEQPAAPVAVAPPPVSEDKRMAGVRVGREFLMGLLERMGVQARVEIVPQSEAEAGDGERMQVLNIVGENLNMLIGRQNEVLSALEFLTRLVVTNQTHSPGYFTLDVNGYRARRAESLRKLALRMAEQAVQTGRTMILEPMPPAERRIIHLALRNHPYVTTQSIGEGDRRKVTIVLKKE